MLVNYLNNNGKQITPDDVIKYGLDGMLQFVVEDANFASTTLTRFHPKPLPDVSMIRLDKKYPFTFTGKNKDKWEFEYVCKADSCITTLPPITPHQFALVMQSNLSERSTDINTHFELTVVSTIGAFNIEQQYLATPRRFYSKENLRITKDEVLKFEKKCLSENVENQYEQQTAGDVAQPLWSDLLINPPQLHSEWFEKVKAAVKSLISQTGSLPDIDNVIEFLDITDKYQKSNLRKSWKRYTKSKDKV